jgi:ribosome-associated protein
MITIPNNEITFRYTCSSGPGGQHVNRVATAVQLRFDINNSQSLSNTTKNRLFQLAKHRINKQGILLIEAKRFRSQDRNRQDAIERLHLLIKQASLKPVRRNKTKPTRASKLQRIKQKKQKSRTKQQRKYNPGRDG